MKNACRDLRQAYFYECSVMGQLLLAANAEQSTDGLPDGAAVKRANNATKHLSDLLFQYLSREDR